MTPEPSYFPLFARDASPILAGVSQEATLREAALELLASSTIRRYIREAARLAANSEVTRELRGDPGKREQARLRVGYLLGLLESERERSPAEFESVILLCALALTDASGTVDLLREAARSSSMWIRALALRLIDLGPPTADEIRDTESVLAAFLEGEVKIGTPPKPDLDGPLPRAA
jgi:hypothetical protein